MDFGETAEPDPSINHDEPTVYIDLFKYAMLGSKCVQFYNFILFNRPGAFESIYKQRNPHFSSIDFYDLGTFALILPPVN